MQSPGRVCIACEQNSTECEFVHGNDSCEYCRVHQLDCFLSRKKRRCTRLTEQPFFQSRTPQPSSSYRHDSTANDIQSQGRSRKSPSITRLPSATHVSGSARPSSSRTEGPSPGNETYIGRAHYLDHDTPFDETQARDATVPERARLSEKENAVLQLYSAFVLPPRAVLRSLHDSFLTYCQPWTPVLSRGEIDHNDQQSPSYILFQSMFLAASRVSTAPSIRSFATPDQFYERAKTLFFMNHETDALAVIKATIMMQWYTPVGPEQVSYDAGEFWLRVGVAIAFQIGLHREPPQGPPAASRRRVWWSLVTRDALMTVAHGRPRAINQQDTNVAPIRPDDLVDAAGRGDGHLFVAYTKICCILGDLSETCSRGTMTPTKSQEFVRLLHEWPSQIPEYLRFPDHELSAEVYMSLQTQLNLRQLHLPYLLSLAIIARSLTNGTISTQPMVAASFVAGTFRDFLARDEIKHLAPIFSRYCIASGFFLALLQPMTDLWVSCQPDMDVLRKALQELGQRWKSARAGLRALDHFVTLREKQSPRSVPRLIWLTKDQMTFFDCLPREYCHMWDSLHAYCSSDVAIPEHISGNAASITDRDTDDGAQQIPSADDALDDRWAFADVDFEEFMWTNAGDWFPTT